MRQVCGADTESLCGGRRGSVSREDSFRGWAGQSIPVANK